MKTHFEFTLQGRDYWKPWTLFWILFLALYIPLVALPGRIDPARMNPIVLLPLQLAFSLAMTLLSAVFSVVFLRLALPKLSIGGEAFSFQGSIGELVKLYLAGFLLSVVTLGIYLPWYIRRVTAYMVSQTGFKGTRPEFLGKGGRLFKYFLLSLFLPILVVSVFIGIAVGLSYGGNREATAAVTMVLTFAVMLFILPPFYYLFYKWFVDLRWDGVTVAWRTAFWPSVYFLFAQLILSLITAGIYAPAAFIKCWRYFSERTVLAGPAGELGHLGFDGSVGKGFGLLWGQALLTIVTVGFYAPWGYARVGRWLAGGTYFEPAAAASATGPAAPAAGGP